MEQSFQPIVSSDIDNTSIDNANTHHVELSGTRLTTFLLFYF